MSFIPIEFSTDLPPQSVVKVVGNTADLGGWDVEKAPALRFDGSKGAFVGQVQVPKESQATAASGSVSSSVEYKIAIKNPFKPEQGWQWVPGPNRHILTGSPSGPGAGDAAADTQRVSWVQGRDGAAVISQDGYLEPHRGHLKHRYHLFSEALAAIEAQGGGLDRFTRGWEQFGLNRALGGADGKQPGILYREWAPGAQSASLVGDFNGWDHNKHVCTKDGFGVFSLFMPDLPSGESAIPHDSFLKLSLVLGSGERVLRLPAWTRYAVYDKATNEYCAKYWCPPLEQRHSWKHPRPSSGTATEDYRRVAGIPALPSCSSYIGAVPPPERPSAREVSLLPKGAGTGAGGGKKTSSPGQPSQTASSAATAATTTGSGNRDPCHAGLRIYEAHVGMSSAEEKVNSYRSFADDVLPRIKALGYNCVQLMAIMEHAYYGSFGYHVTSFLAPSSRFGTPEDLKYLVDACHGLGMMIIMDLVHSHAAKNVNDGLNAFDGTDHQYFHSGAKGNHDLWDSRLFDYSRLEVQRFLLSSARLFIEEFRFDGYRFDGVTSMMYHHHGLSFGFSGDYNEYFSDATDLSAVVYLMLANHMLHSLSPPAMSIAEDVSGMPTLCRPVYEGGVGFDFRLAMAIPDQWIKILKESKDEDWDMAKITHTLTNRRWQEKTIAYAESHDQALVGDKTLAFWLMDKEMYWHMSSMEKPRHAAVDRGLALHKMIRLLTYGLGGEGWLNFMGNEFGHPEWIDFPREGNNWSYKHCRRQWNLVDDDLLLYRFFNAFDGGMHHLEDRFPWLISRDNYVSLKHEGDKMIVFERGTAGGPLVFVFNFHPTNSYTDYRIGVPSAGEWEIALDSDWAQFGGYNRVDKSTTFVAENFGWNERPGMMHVYSPCRTVQVYKKKGTGGTPVPDDVGKVSSLRAGGGSAAAGGAGSA